MNKTLILLLLTSLMLVINSCATTKIADKKSKEKPADVSKIEIPQNNLELNNLRLKGRLKANLNGQSNSASFDIKIAGRDSLFMRILGPFSIEVVRFYANKDVFLAYNLIGGTAFTGKPDAESLQEAIGIGVSFQELISLLRSEVPFDFSDYKRVGCDTVSCSYSNDNYSFCQVSTSDIILNYERKTSELESIFTANLELYRNIQGFQLANKFNFKFPDIGNVELVISEFEVNVENLAKMSFSLPSSLKVKNIGGVER